MASNCPFWKNRKCAGTNSDYYHYCSLDTSAFQECAVYKMIRIRSAGGGMLDMLKGSGLIDDKTPVAGVNLRRRLSDQELKKALEGPAVIGSGGQRRPEGARSDSTNSTGSSSRSPDRVQESSAGQSPTRRWWRLWR